MKSDNEPSLTSLIETWTTWTATKGGSRIIIEDSPVESSKSNGVIDRAIQSVQGMIGTIRSAIEEKWMEDRCDSCRMAVDRRASWMFLNEVRSRS